MSPGLSDCPDMTLVFSFVTDLSLEWTRARSACRSGSVDPVFISLLVVGSMCFASISMVAPHLIRLLDYLGEIRFEHDNHHRNELPVPILGHM